ncbi:F0F1 ATP synthase subunit A [Cystobacter fuscus]|uniref:F0F1 ATP synthase subunit A n=1 Tax=Cystobacter fuscus TaxID=43 RepID=UPI0037C186B0
MRPHVFGDEVVAWLGPFPLTDTMLTSGLISLALVLVAALLGHATEHRPGSRLAALGRLSWRALDGLVTETAGKSSPSLTVFAGSLFAFIAACALAGQLPSVRAPTASVSTSSALALLVFLAVPVAGIHARGWKRYLRDYVRPNPLFLPLHLVSELSRTLALSLRLFGNMMSGHLLVALLVALTGLLVPTPLMALDLLIGLLQAYIFTVLTCVYIGAAIRRGDEA